MSLSIKLNTLSQNIEGDVLTDVSHRLIYATDASAYRKIPVGVIRPKNAKDIKKIIAFANKNNTSLIFRTAGTSLAGQVVGSGIVVDVSKYMNRILELNIEEKWIRVQPGVVLDELNKYLAPHGLFFGPETSTSTHCMIGGMVGNNACGAHSLIYGSTRDHTLELNTILSDGSEAVFSPLTNEDFIEKCKGKKLENLIYQNIREILSSKKNQKEIRDQFPDKEIKRRNTGYAIDILLETSPFSDNKTKFNFSKLLAGSEGTLACITDIKLNLVPLPPKEKVLICAHMHTLQDAFKANLIALKYKPDSIELMDDVILELTKKNIEQNKNRFFIKGNPKAILIIEFARNTKDEIIEISKKMKTEMLDNGFGYHFPLIFGKDIEKVWKLRKAGLGILFNMPGDAKPVPVIEDTAVNPKVLPNYLEEFQKMIDKYALSCVYYAHIATGELHLRPVLNLKLKKDVALFHTLALETAKLVKKYKGSLSGEHGDGRLRGEFIPFMIGEHNYNLLKEIKNTWDPNHIFNPKKIIDTPKMNTSLRYKTGVLTRQFNTYFDFSKTHGILRAAEQCNGVGYCRKTEIIGGVMCPSYMASHEENQTTRARANVLREFLTNSDKKNPFDHKEIYQIMDLCLSCKACKSECPSSVDVAKLKAEFLQHYYDTNGVPFRTKIIGNMAKLNRYGSKIAIISNFFFRNIVLSNIIKKIIGFSLKRKLPTLHKTSVRKYFDKLNQTDKYKKEVYLFADEFTNYNEADIGIKSIQLLNKLGYKVNIIQHMESGRTYISKGLLKKAKQIANSNVLLFKEIITKKKPLVGIEPSAILTFRDEYIDLVEVDLREKTNKLAKNTFLIDEFLCTEFEKGNITKASFTKEKKTIKLHGHCYQKALASLTPTIKILSIPENYTVSEIPSGCCGMAGSFGYEKEHYDLSMQIGELVLFPAVRAASDVDIIAASGTSCRQQIEDGTKKKALHPIEILWDAIKK